nr:hypothetical protein [Chloroflexia bacterium]
LGRWAAGSGFLTLHISVFLSATVVLFMVNLATAPADLWADNVFWPWAVLLVIHGLAVALVLLIGLLRGDASGLVPAATSAGTEHDTRPAALAATINPEHAPQWSSATAQTPGEAAPLADPALAMVTPPLSDETWPGREPPPTPDNGADAASADPEETSEHGERVSWEEAGIGAWLTRRSRDGDTAPDTGPHPEHPEPSDAKD